MGGALAAALVGPSTALVCLSVVLLVQALLFADGGLTALGTNVTLIGVVTVLVGYAVTRLLLTATRRWSARPAAVVPAAAAGAFVSVPAAALVFVLLYQIGGTVPIPLATLTAAMVGWHLVIGVGEAVITAVVLSAVVAVRPDLVYAVRDRRRTLVLDDPTTPADQPADGAPAARAGGDGDGHVDGLLGGLLGGHEGEAVARPARPSVRSARGLAGAALSVSLVVAGLVALLSSARPDGLEFVAEALGFDEAARDSAVAASPLADYGFTGLGAVGTTVAGVVGVAVTLLAVWLIASLRRAGSSGAGAGPERATASAR